MQVFPPYSARTAGAGPDAIERNLRAMLCCYGRVAPHAEVDEAEAVTCIYSAVNYPAFNIALLNAECIDAADGFFAAVAAARAWFAARRAPWTFWFHDQRLAPWLRRRVESLLEDSDLTYLAELPAMRTSGLPPTRRQLPPLQIRPVSDPVTRLDFTHVTALCYAIPMEPARQVYGRPEMYGGPFAGFVGYWDGLPVATVGLLADDEVVGVYSVATLADYRGRGCAEFMLRAALAAVGGPQDRTIVLESSQQGLSLYKKLGFRKVSTFWVAVAQP